MPTAAPARAGAPARPGLRSFPARIASMLALAATTTATAGAAGDDRHGLPPLVAPAAAAVTAPGPGPGATGAPSIAESLGEGDRVGPWTLVGRSIDARSGAAGGTGSAGWTVDAVLRYDGDAPAVLAPGAVRAEVDGWVSNSRIPGHASPRRAAHAGVGTPGASARSELIRARDPARSCAEHARLTVGPGAVAAPPEAAGAGLGVLGVPPIVVAPGGTLPVRLVLEHEHFLYGPYEPLLGIRTLTLRIGTAVVRDRLPLDQEPRPTDRVPAWPAVATPAPEASAPDGRYLLAGGSGSHFWRVAGPVRYGTRMVLRYRYLIAPGSEGVLHEQVRQFRQGAGVAWKALHDGDRDQPRPETGRWVEVEAPLRTEPEATWLSVEFRLTGPVGEAWIDGLSLQPARDTPGP